MAGVSFHLEQSSTRRRLAAFTQNFEAQAVVYANYRISHSYLFEKKNNIHTQHQYKKKLTLHFNGNTTQSKRLFYGKDQHNWMQSFVSILGFCLFVAVISRARTLN